MDNKELALAIQQLCEEKGLTPEDIQKIVKLEIAKFEKHIAEMGYKFKIGKPALEFIAKEGYDKTYGARPLNRAIQRYVEDPIADEILYGNIKEGQTIQVSLDKANKKIKVKGI